MMMTATTTTTAVQNTTSGLHGSPPSSDYGARDISDSDCDSDNDNYNDSNSNSNSNTNTNSNSNSNTPSENQPRPAETATIAAAESRKFLVWHMPWRIALVLFTIFFVLWACIVVVQRYWLKEEWDAALPGLGTSVFRKHTMRFHMTFGAVAILCSFIQMTTPFASGWKKGTSMTRNWYRQIHRFSGRVYTMCAIVSFFFGQWFIFLKEFVLVGGYSMGLSFSCAGFSIAYFAYMAYKTAPGKNNTDGRYTIEDHRNYAIRSFSQIIAPLLYRYWYVLLDMLNLYRAPHLNGGDAEKGENLVCDDQNVCDDYLRPFDFLYAWFYWIGALVVAEVVIACLPRHHVQAQAQAQAITSTVSGSENEVERPLLETTSQPTMDESIHTHTDSVSEDTNTTGSDVIRIEIQIPSILAIAIANYKDGRPKTLVLNFIGCLLAVFSTIVTGSIVVMMVASTFKYKQ